MLTSCDTNILLYYLNADCKEHAAAKEFIEAEWNNELFAVCELVLIELYVLLRTPSVVANPMSSSEAINIVEQFRANPSWRVIDYPGALMDKIWALAKRKNFARREIFDARLALTLSHRGVSRFATHNPKHFLQYEFEKVFDPIK
jgi:toxin-antitoxin system PIN domain toxin